MAIGVRSVSSVASDTTATQVCNKPTGAVFGDLLVAICSRSQTLPVASFSASGWTQEDFFAATADYASVGVLTRPIASSGEPSSYTFSSPGFTGPTDQFNIHMLCLTGVATGAPIAVNAAKTDAGSANANVVAPSITIPTGLGDQALLVCHFITIRLGTTDSFAPPSGMVERIDVGGNWVHQETATELRNSGATGTRTASCSNTPSFKPRAISFAIAPLITDQTITATSINPDFAVGSAVVTTGDVTIAPTGIVSVGAMGTAVVAQIIAPVGIPSAEVFGVADLTGGVRPTGIPSGEVFGAAAVTAGDITITVTSIPDESGMGLADVQGSVIDNTSIDSAEAFGAAVVTPGPVDILPTGIPSQFDFGDHAVAQFVTALRAEILVRPKPKTSYEVVWMAKVPQQSGPPLFFAVDPLEWTSISYTEQLSAVPTLDFTCQISTITDSIRQRFRNPSELATEIWVYRNGKITFAGPLVGATVQGEDLNFAVDGLMSYLDNMLITQDIIFKNADQFSIVKSLVDVKQAGSYGDYGIVTSNIGISGVTLDITYLKSEHNYILPKIQDLGKSATGFDITINSSSRNIELYHPQMGVDRSTGPEAIVFDDKDITDTNIVLSLASKDLASDIHGVGTGTGQDGAEIFYSTLSNNDLLTQYGRSELELSFRDISSQAQLDALVLAASEARVRPLWIPGPNVRVTPNADISAYNVGDTVFYRLHHNLEVQGAFRLLKRTIHVSSTGDETVSAAFV